MIHADALRIATGLRTLLERACERIEIAGSVRRKKPECKDIELVAVPRYEEVTTSADGQGMLLGSRRVSMLDATIDAWLSDGVARPRLGKDGKAALGRRYKRLLVDYGEPGLEAVALDLFVVEPPAQWGLVLMIRTGSGVGPQGDFGDGFGPAMLARWKQVSGGGYSKDGCLHWPDGSPRLTPEQGDVFIACKVAWVEPEARTDASAVWRNAYD